MASAKEYGYFIKGNKFSLLEKDTALDNDVNSRDYGPDVTNVRYTSPQSSVTDGIELEYIYSPKYKVYSNSTINKNKFYILGWTIEDGYLTFLRNGYGVNDGNDWTAVPESAVTTGSSGDTGGQSLDYIVIRGSSKWNGLHRIKSAATTGKLQTYTKVSKQLPSWDAVDADIDSNWTVYDGGGVTSADNVHLADHFIAGDYVWMDTSSSSNNRGLFKVSSISQSDTDTSSKITFDTRYSIPQSDNSTTASTGLDQVYVQSLVAGEGSTNTGSSTRINIYKAYYDHCYLLTDVDVLNDESDELPLSEYLSKAVVYYLKAKLAEDQGNFQLRDVMFKEFYRIVEKSDNAKIHTIRKVVAHSAAIR